MNRTLTGMILFVLSLPTFAVLAQSPATTQPQTVLEYLAVTAKTLRPLQAEFVAAVTRHDTPAAEAVCKRLIAEVPYSPDGYYNLACIRAISGQKEEAFTLLEDAIHRGFNNVAHIESDADLKSLHDDPRFAELKTQAAGAKPALATKPPEPFLVLASQTDQTAWVQPSNVAFEPRLGLPVAIYKFDPKGPGDRAITTLQGPAGDLLKQWWKDGTAAGNWGDLYDNRDGDHSDVPRALFPQMTWIEYSQPAKDAQLNYGVAQTIIHDAPLIGNASVAATQGIAWRSMPRVAMQSPQGATLLYLHYTNNKMYVYPSHVDYSPGRKGRAGLGDVYFANTPYLLTSLGSSYTDQPHLQALAATMAAFRPEVKKQLIQKKLLAPTLQMIFRMSNPSIKAPEDYFNGAVHRPVFAQGQFAAEKMVTLAHDMAPDSIPPLVRLKVVDEDKPNPGVDFFALPGQSNMLFDTPCAIARVYRSLKPSLRMVISAADSVDANNKPLTYHWAVLQGDAKKIVIKPLNESGTLVELTVPYTPGFTNTEGLETNRIDIGAFANNGVNYSAPAFVTFYMLDHEDRTYEKNGRLLSVTYNDHYVDPVVSLSKNWRDDYQYDVSGKLLGWTRHVGDKIDHFDPEGRLDGKGVRYIPKSHGGDEAPELVYEIAP